jgi:halocyanin-like protein
MTERDVSRRGFLRTAAGTGVAGAAAGAGVTGTATAQEAPYDGYLSGVDNFDGSTVDATGQGEVTIAVGAEANGGGFAFDPPAVQVDPGTTLVWEWTGQGGQHNVVDEGGAFESDLVDEEGVTFEHTVDSEGVLKYFCQPHEGLGMRGVAAVGDTAEKEAGGDGNSSDSGNSGGGNSSSSSGQPDFGGYLGDVGNFDGTVVDARGQEEATVEVGVEANGGNLGFGPPAVHVDNGATVVWRWTGEGGAHNVVDEGGAFESELTAEGGFSFEHTFDEDGVYNYFCQPHQSLGMKGSVVVGSDFPSTGGGGGSVGPSGLPNTAKTLSVATVFVLVATLGLAYVFIKFGGDYGELET